ncbi:receptor-like protein EIX2 [Alnus glutinosa]|uniref:receptor-like protein EIX2 n=1 Tax=Alnus glutinosa TaxID=3517 RepID=UPI002D788EE1|nr:receptor-like protein EIX2 [Alnus glutinosa]
MISTHLFMSTVHLLLIFFFSFFGTASYLRVIQPVSCTKNPIFKCSEMETKALLSFKEGLTDPSGRLSSWVGEDCCNWTGVGCDNSIGHVVKLNLRNSLPVIESEFIEYEDDYDEIVKAYEKSCLEGKISPSLLNLKHLSYLDLSLNNFSGNTIPKFLGSLESLMYLNLSFSMFAGVVPPHLGNLSRLQYLDLNSLDLEVKSLEWLVGFPSLRYLNLGYVNLEKVPHWLHSVNMLPSLVELHLFDCGLTSLPHSVSSNNLTLLSVLDLSHNNLNSSIPHWLSNVSSLSTINLGYNSLRGAIPDGMGHLANLRSLELAYNVLIGKIPSSFSNLCNLQTLKLYSTNISGEVVEFLDGLSQCSNSSLEYLDLSENIFLGGNLPYSLGGLKNLKTIYLFESSFGGSIPDSIGNLTSLQTLYLSLSSVGGSIPDSIGNLTSLQTLYLSLSSVGGSIPDSIGNLMSLQELYLYLSGSSVGGSIPDSIGNLTSLQELDLSYNQMNGVIPESIGKLSMLVSLSLSSNPWEGFLTEAHFQNLTRLKFLDLSVELLANYTLVFNVKHDWVPPFKLRRIYLRNMKIGPKFPAWLQTQNKLIEIGLDNVGISDTIPHGLWKSCPNVTSWSLSGNKLRGQVPYFQFHPSAAYFDLSSNNLEGPLPLFRSNLSFLLLQNNMFSGAIPENISELLPKLSWLDLSSNSITGRIPHSIGMLKELTGLVLRNNSLSRKLPPHWKDLRKLVVLNLAENNISGSVPSSMQYLKSLQQISLSQNHLEGELPFFFRNYRYLGFLDLGGNKFSGKLPAWIGESLSSLVKLSLRSNLFHGNIPPQLCLLSSLQILDLANNDFSGAIPQCLGNFSDDGYSRYYNYSDQEMLLVSKGREYLFGWSIIRFFHSIDLSNNNLSGEIPGNITSHLRLVNLNLSMNHLIGRIPEKIGDLHMLESLDLSINELSGPIPESLSSLTFLNHLNLSFNNLSGKIPNGNQLQTLNDSSIYEGNSLLCGPPLSTKCSEDETKPRVAKENGRGIESISFYVSMVAGFIFGFWGICGTLIIKTSWRHAYFRSFDNLKDKIAMFVVVKIVHLLRKVK